MLMTLQAYYLCASAALFLYGLSSPRHALRAFVLGIALNVFPLALQPYMNMDVARLGSMPLVYLPVTVAGVALILHNGLHFPRCHRSLYVFAVIYIVYTLCNTVLARGLTTSNVLYWLAWPMNILMLIAVASCVARMDTAFVNRMLGRLVQVLVAASVVGLARYASGFESDANFIPLMNRNGTVVLIALLFPLVFHVYDTQRKSRLWLLGCAGTIALCVAMTFSRSGLVGLMAGVVMYYWRFSLMGVVKLAAAVTVLSMFLASGVAERTTERLLLTGRTVSALVQNEDVDRSVGDRNRVMLVHGALATARSHFWFGTGLGMENYREGLSKASPLPLTSKAHNFYISYFAELGLFGFVLLLAVLQRIYASLAPLGSRNRAFRVSFLVMALMMTMNEYILLPELWMFFGMLAGISRHTAAAGARVAASARIAAVPAVAGAPAAGNTAVRALPRFGLGGGHGR